MDSLLGRMPAGHRRAGGQIDLSKQSKVEPHSHFQVDGVEVTVDSMEAILAHVSGQDVQNQRMVGLATWYAR